MPIPENPASLLEYRARIIRQLQILERGEAGFTVNETRDLLEIYGDFIDATKVEIDKHVAIGNINLNDVLFNGR